MSKVIDKLVLLIADNFDIGFENIEEVKSFEDKRVPGQYAIRLFIKKDFLDFAVRHAIPNKPFKLSKDVIETNFSSWPPASMEFNEIFHYNDRKQ